MTANEMRQLSDEELREISLRKNRRGRYTAEADMHRASVRNEAATGKAFRGDLTNRSMPTRCSPRQKKRYTAAKNTGDITDKEG